MKDPVREAALAGRLVIWEESARDGAQGKTLMTGPQRVALARATGELFGEHGPNHVIFGAGFPAIAPEECEIVRQLAAEVDNCSLAPLVRGRRDDVDLGLRAMEGARHGRVAILIPVSEPACDLVGITPHFAIDYAIQLARYALDRAGDRLAIDITMGDATRADPQFVAESALRLYEEGISLCIPCDSVGLLYPRDSFQFHRTMYEQLPPEVLVGTHLHNDLGFGLANNLEAIRAGARVVSTSWLGLGERNGLCPTEQLLFALAFEPERLSDRLGHDASKLWLTPPNLKGLVPIAQQVSRDTGVPLKMTDAIVGPGVNSISTGTPFLNPHVMHPFDPEAVLGVERSIVATHLASARVIEALAQEMNIPVDRERVKAAVHWIKSEAYRRGTAVIPKEELARFLAAPAKAPIADEAPAAAAITVAPDDEADEPSSAKPPPSRRARAAERQCAAE